MEKLVRDRIPEIMANQNKHTSFYIATSEQYDCFLKTKLLEEVEEFIRDETIEELADIYEVLEALLVHNNISPNHLKKVQISKRKHRGGFQKKIIMKVDS